MFLQLVISGMAFGSLYSLVALGVVLIYKATGIVNMAQGTMALFAAYFSYTFTTGLGMGPIPAALIALVLSALLALIIDRVAIRPLVGAPVLAAVAMTLALDIMLKNAATLIWGANSRRVPSIFPREPLNIGGIIVAWDHVAIVAVMTVLVLMLYVLFRRTRTGYFMTAVAQDRTLPLLLGISVTRVFAVTWAVAGILGGVAGLMLTQTLFLGPQVMGAFLFKALTAAVVGGLSSIPGAAAGGLLLGVAENLVTGYISAEFRDVIAFILIFITLAARPNGIFGTVQQRRV